MLFDGVCNLCNASIRFVIGRDPGSRFCFASLQSTLGRRLVAQYDLHDDLSTVILVEDSRAYTRSTAALRIARRLAGFWKALALLRVVPRPLRDRGYDWVARNRYRWFGRQDVCWRPEPRLAARFIDDDPEDSSGSAP